MSMRSKTLLVTLLLITATVASYGQQFAGKFLKEFDYDRNFSVVNITPEMFGMMGNMDIDDPDLASLIKNIDGLRIVSAPSNKPVYEKWSLKSLTGFEEIMSIRSPRASDMRLMLQRPTNKVKELVMFVKNDTSFVVVNIAGNMEMKQLSKLSGITGVKELEQLDKTKDKDK